MDLPSCDRSEEYRGVRGPFGSLRRAFSWWEEEDGGHGIAVHQWIEVTSERRAGEKRWKYALPSLVVYPSCNLPAPNVPSDWITMADPCVQKMKDQVREEIKAAMTYLTMGAHFSRDVINRPGFAKFFFESATEEREHAIKLMSYLLMRGELTSDLALLIDNPRALLKDTWSDGLSALTQALNLETHVTKKIREVVKVCEEAQKNDNQVFNDYHLVDYLSGEFLEEQYKGQRELAGMISTLSKMNQTHKKLGEFLFDKKLLNGEPL